MTDKEKAGATFTAPAKSIVMYFYGPSRASTKIQKIFGEAQKSGKKL